MDERAAVYQSAVDLFNRILEKFRRLENTPKNFGTGDLLTRSEIHFLAGVYDNPLLSVTDLADKIGVTKGAVSQMTAKLHTKGYVRKLHGVEDRKEVLLALTDKGKTAADNHNEFHRSIFELYCSDLSQTEVDVFVNVLKRIEKFTDDQAD